jgi:rhodanese-related sulfurtransferase
MFIKWQTTGIIPGSHPMKFFDQNGKYDTQQWLAEVQKLQSSPDQEIILVCHSGGRSGKVGELLSEKLNMPNVSHLKNGITSWIQEQRPTEKACAEKLVSKNTSDAAYRASSGLGTLGVLSCICNCSRPSFMPGSPP